MKRTLCILLAFILLSGIIAPTVLAETSTTLDSTFRTVPMVEAGAIHSVALHSDGTVWTWGHNMSGQLGIGITGDQAFRTFPHQVPNLNNVIQVAAGIAHTLALRSDGTVWAWGDNFFGQLGIGTGGRDFDMLTGTHRNALPVQIPTLSNITAISAGDVYSLALQNDGTVWAWGNNSWGAIGDGTYGFNNFATTPTRVHGLTNITYIAAGGMSHAAAVRSDGTVWTWGHNAAGELGDGTTTDRLTPVQVPGITNAVSVSVGGNLLWGALSGYTVAVLDDNTALAWGGNSWGQLGYSPIPGIQTSPVPVFLQDMSNVTTLSAGSSHALALSADGTTWSWGSNHNGQLGLGFDGTRVPNSATPDLVNCPRNPDRARPAFRAVSVSAGDGHSLALKADGTVWAWGNNANGQGGMGANIPQEHSGPVQVIGPNGIGFLNLNPAQAPPAQQTQAPGIPFTDVFSDSWFLPYVRSMYANNVMQGTNPTTFAPKVSISRVQIVAMLFRIQNGHPAIHRVYVDLAPHRFHDVNHGGWMAPYVAWADANFISAGASVAAFTGGPAFRPNESIERQEIAMLMHNYIANLTGLDRSSTATPQWNAFTDRGQIGGEAAYNALRWANNNGIINGRDATTIAPTATATRAEAAAMLHRFMVLVADAPPPQPGQQRQAPTPPGQPPLQPDPPATPAHQDTNASEFEMRVLELTNSERARHGLAPLSWDNTLGTAARNHSIDMATRVFFDHTCPSGGTFLTRGAHGENIAMGQTTPEVVVLRWMESPGHRANILNPNFTYLGVGFYVGETRIFTAIAPYFWTQKFI